MTTISSESIDSNSELVTPSKDDVLGERMSISEVVMIAHDATTIPTEDGSDFETIEEWLDEEQTRVGRVRAEQSRPVNIVDGRIQVNESAMMFETPYRLVFEGQMLHVVLTYDGAIEIYEVGVDGSDESSDKS